MAGRIFCFLCLCGLTFTASGQDNAAKPFLWEARNGQTTVYLLGSVHELRPGDHPLHPLMEDACERSDQVAFELDLDEAKSASVLLLGLQKGTYSPPDNLAAHLSQETYDRVVQYAQANGIRFYDLYRPWFLSQVLTTKELSHAGFEANLGIDKHFFDLAKDRGKTIKALESASFQINVLASLPEEKLIASVEKFLADPALAVSQVVQVVEAWKRGDGEALRRAIENEFRDDPQSFDLLLTQRNQNWLPAIEGFLKENRTTVVVVGAAHLVGETGLVTLLRRKGYDVEQLPRATVATPPRFKAIERLLGSELRLTLEVESGQRYGLQTSSDLERWANVLDFVATGSTQVVTNDVPLNASAVFFRIAKPQL